MAIAVTGTETISYGSYSSYGLTIPAGTTGAVVGFVGYDTWGISSVDIGGEPLAQLGSYIGAGAVESASSLWWINDVRGRANDTLTFDAMVGQAYVVYFSALGPLTRDVNASTLNSSGNTSVYQDSDASVPTLGGNQLAIVQRYLYSGSASTSAGTVILNSGQNGAAYDIDAADTAVSAGVYMAGGSFWGHYMGVTIYESVVILNVTPDPLPLGLGFNAGAIAFSGDVTLLGTRMRALRLLLRPGRLGSTSKRQVALVGPDDAPHIFTPEMTEGGDEGNILTQHADSPPTWEPTTHYEPVRFDTDGDGVADDWLYHSDGDVVMLEVLD